jgi:hypothetical protein
MLVDMRVTLAIVQPERRQHQQGRQYLQALDRLTR